ncbi:MAG: hypothetical protein ACOY0T_30025 [Myxococcota bacterium]
MSNIIITTEQQFHFVARERAQEVAERLRRELAPILGLPLPAWFEELIGRYATACGVHIAMEATCDTSSEVVESLRRDLEALPRIRADILARALETRPLGRSLSPSSFTSKPN